MIDSLTPTARLKHRVDHWVIRLRVMPKTIRVQEMKRKWGSCSTLGTVSLAVDLDSKSKRFQDFVIVHELLHLKVHNHGRLFKALMTVAARPVDAISHYGSSGTCKGTVRLTLNFLRFGALFEPKWENAHAASLVQAP